MLSTPEVGSVVYAEYEESVYGEIPEAVVAQSTVVPPSVVYNTLPP